MAAAQAEVVTAAAGPVTVVAEQEVVASGVVEAVGEAKVEAALAGEATAVEALETVMEGEGARAGSQLVSREVGAEAEEMAGEAARAMEAEG